MSTIIIRLQNLPLSAKAADIREFFGDLKIPKGSVNIVGGPHGDAFIGFSTDEDARLAMLLDGRLLHNAKIHLMLSSKREMQDVIAAAQAQAQAIKSGRDPAATQAQNNQQLNGSTKSESITSKAEVAEPSSTGQIQQMYDGSQLPQQLLPPSFPQLFQQPPIAATQSPKTFSGDSWKNPQQQHQTSGFGSLQINVAAGQQQTTQLVGQTSPQQSPVFPTSMPPPSQFTMPPPQIPQHQYQQLPTPQLPGFPPPIGQQPPPIGQSQIPPIGGFQQPPPNLSRPPFMNPPPQLQSTGNNDKFFNQPPQQQSGASPRFPPAQFGGNNQPVSQQQFFGRQGGIQGQQQQFGGRSTGPQGIHGNFRQNQQQQFGRRTPNQTFTGAGQRPQQQQFGVQQRPTGNFRPNFGQQQRFGGQNQQQFGLKRQRSRSPNMDQGANKRFNFPMSNDNTGFAGQGQKQHFPQRQEKQRICIQLSNVPYKATYNDIQDYLSATKTKCIKCTRVYMPDRNYSDRWIVEFDNEEAAREVCKYQGEIAGRTIRAERITPRRADEQYAVMEPEEKDKDNGGNDRRSRRDRDGRRESRDGNRSRSNGNRDRSRGNLNRGNDHDRPSSREKNQDRSHDRSKSRGRKRSKSQEGRRTNTEERGENRQKRNSPNKEDVLPSNQPIPLNASLGSFLFPQANQQNVCNAKSGGTAQLGLTEGIKPIPLRSTPQFFPTISSVPPPSLVSTFISGNNNNGNGHVQSPTEEQQLFHQQSQPAFNSSWPSKKSATGANAMPLGQRTNASSGPCAISSVPPTPTFNCSDLSFESTIGSSGPALIIDTDGEGDLDGDDIGAAVNRNEDIDRSVHTGISHDQKPTNAAASIFGTSATLQALSSIPDQPPLDLLEPIDDNKPVDQKHFNASQLQLFPPSSSESRLPSFLAPNFSLDERPLFDSKSVLTPNIGSNEFSQQEVELRPHLQFLNNYKVDPNLKSCLRLENVPKMVFVDQLSDFLGTKINVPSQNIARMFNGVLYINLDNELFAIKAASRNGQFLSGSQIGITQLRKCEMADAIRQNMIIIREMYRVMVVVRGFPLNAQQNEVIALFERFNVNRDAIEKCAVRNSDSHSAFILTFPSTQDCQNAVRELNGVQISGGIRLEVFQPEKFGI